MAFNKGLLRRKIQEAGISQAKLAKLVGVNQRTVYRWLNGEKPPKADHIARLAETLRCRPDEFDPRYADGENDIRVEGKVSAASHNAYAAMKLIYEVDEQTIIELAPVLFAIAAARAINLPAEDTAWRQRIESEAKSFGMDGLRLERQGDYESFQIDAKAAQQGRCFGLPSDEDFGAAPRNLFVEAMRRMANEAGDLVNIDRCAPGGAGEVPTAFGCVPHTALFDYIAEQNPEIVQRLAIGHVRLSKSVLKADLNGSLEDKAEIIRNDLSEQVDDRRAKMVAKRKVGLAKLAKWRAHYEEQYPYLAKEYDDLVAAYCKPEDWYPSYYDDLAREQADANPFAEIRFIDNDLLPRPANAQKRVELWLSFNAPEQKRFRELREHRARSKAEFKEGLK
jgi:transcriptional regulator with XRE-family HTH domain